MSLTARTRTGFHRGTLIALLFLGVLPAAHATLDVQVDGGNSPAPPTPAITVAIQRIATGARILAKDDVDAKECGDTLPHQPGLVVADLKGNSKQDFAVLVKTGETGKVTEWEGKKLRLTNYAFAIFLDDGNGAFTLKLVKRFQDYAPLAAYIDLQPPGKVTDQDNGKNVTLQHPGVSLVFCEKSASLYHLVGQEIKTVQLAD